jgi:hypothetical protein
VLPRITTRRTSAPGRCHVEELLTQSENLPVGQIIDINTDIAENGARDIAFMLLDIRDELVRRIRFTRPMPEDENRIRTPDLLSE